jgi:hypothetical protein
LIRLTCVKRPWLCAVLVAAMFGSMPMSTASAHSPSMTPAWARVHYADLDGDGHADKIWFTLGADFDPGRWGQKSGHWTVHALISSTGATVSRTFLVDGYGALSKTHWTPWVGATDLDHTGGEEIVLGAEGAADAVLYRVLVYWNGSLRILPSPQAPNTPDWVIIGAYLHGAGFRCSAHGVTATEYAAANRRATRWKLDQSSYVWLNDSWRLVSAKTRTVHAKPEHAPPVVARYGGFACKGLPRYG